MLILILIVIPVLFSNCNRLIEDEQSNIIIDINLKGAKFSTYNIIKGGLEYKKFSLRTIRVSLDGYFFHFKDSFYCYDKDFKEIIFCFDEKINVNDTIMVKDKYLHKLICRYSRFLDGQLFYYLETLDSFPKSNRNLYTNYLVLGSDAGLVSSFTTVKGNKTSQEDIISYIGYGFIPDDWRELFY